MGINSLTHRDDGSRVAVPVSTDDWAEAAGRRGCRAAVTLLLPSRSYTSIWNKERSGTPSGFPPIR